MTKTLQQVMAEYPDLTAWGFCNQTDLENDRKILADSESDFEFCVQWIRENVRPSEHFDYSLYRTSYGLKHTAEAQSPKKYLRNGTFIAAWIALGDRKWERIADTPNARLALWRSDEKAIECGNRRKIR